jgi:hypothetical protein
MTVAAYSQLQIIASDAYENALDSGGSVFAVHTCSLGVSHDYGEIAYHLCTDSINILSCFTSLNNLQALRWTLWMAHMTL